MARTARSRSEHPPGHGLARPRTMGGVPTADRGPKAIKIHNLPT